MPASTALQPSFCICSFKELPANRKFLYIHKQKKMFCFCVVCESIWICFSSIISWSLRNASTFCCSAVSRKERYRGFCLLVMSLLVWDGSYLTNISSCLKSFVSTSWGTMNSKIEMWWNMFVHIIQAHSSGASQFTPSCAGCAVSWPPASCYPPGHNDTPILTVSGTWRFSWRAFWMCTVLPGQLHPRYHELHLHVWFSPTASTHSNLLLASLSYI